MKLNLTRSVKPRFFNRKTRKYESLPIVNGTIAFRLEPAGGTILLFE